MLHNDCHWNHLNLFIQFNRFFKQVFHKSKNAKCCAYDERGKKLFWKLFDRFFFFFVCKHFYNVRYMQRPNLICNFYLFTYIQYVSMACINFILQTSLIEVWVIEFYYLIYIFPILFLKNNSQNNERVGWLGSYIYIEVAKINRELKWELFTYTYLMKYLAL